MNRPFFRSGQDVRESIFSQINQLSRSVFCFFSSRKEIVPLLFFLEEKPVGMRGKRNPSDGRTQAHPALSSVGIPQRVCLPPPPCLCPCPPRLRATQNGCLLFFLEEKTVGMRGKRNPSDGRTQAHPALSSVGIPQRVCLPPPPCPRPCPPRLRATQNGCLLFFLEEKTVSMRGKRSPSGGRLLFFLEEKKQKKIDCG